jgi:GT2 family glycosyltransferase
MENKNMVDVIILSYAQNEELKLMTENCIRSLMASEDPELIQFNVIIVESQKEMEPYQYENTTTVYSDEVFGYHRYMNIGVNMTSSPYVCLCNNDLVFHPQWATEILKAFSKYYDLSSASPYCPTHHKKMGFNMNNGIYPGYRIRYEVAGWCIFIKREILSVTGKLDENYEFWCADNDYANTLYVLKIGHALISTSLVDHLESRTLNSQSQERKDELTADEFFYYEKKWNVRLGNDWEKLN